MWKLIILTFSLAFVSPFAFGQTSCQDVPDSYSQLAQKSNVLELISQDLIDAGKFLCLDDRLPSCPNVNSLKRDHLFIQVHSDGKMLFQNKRIRMDEFEDLAEDFIFKPKRVLEKSINREGALLILYNNDDLTEEKDRCATVELIDNLVQSISIHYQKIHSKLAKKEYKSSFDELNAVQQARLYGLAPTKVYTHIAHFEKKENINSDINYDSRVSLPLKVRSDAQLFLGKNQIPGPFLITVLKEVKKFEEVNITITVEKSAPSSAVVDLVNAVSGEGLKVNQFLTVKDGSIE